MRVALSNSMDLKTEELWRLDKAWAEFSAECVSKMSPDYLSSVQLLSSHGHTVFHNPNDGYSVQIGSGAVLAARTNLPVVCDLRSLDIAYGGQGAPLVPLVDKTLFSEYDACLNLGGFANISRLPKAWDIGVCNNLLNKLALEKPTPLFPEGGQLQELRTWRNCSALSIIGTITPPAPASSACLQSFGWSLAKRANGRVLPNSNARKRSGS